MEKRTTQRLIRYKKLLESLENVDQLETRIYQGYCWYRIPKFHPLFNHPRRNRQYLKRSVLVLEKKLGRPLLPGEMVHHLDGDRLNDHPSNLSLTNRSYHMGQHSPVDIRWDRQREYLANRRLLVLDLWNAGVRKTRIREIMKIGAGTINKYLEAQ